MTKPNGIRKSDDIDWFVDGLIRKNKLKMEKYEHPINGGSRTITETRYYVERATLEKMAGEIYEVLDHDIWNVVQIIPISRKGPEYVELEIGHYMRGCVPAIMKWNFIYTD